MSDDDNENVAVRFDKPALESTSVLVPVAGFEKEIPET